MKPYRSILKERSSLSALEEEEKDIIPLKMILTCSVCGKRIKRGQEHAMVTVNRYEFYTWHKACAPDHFIRPDKEGPGFVLEKRKPYVPKAPESK